MTFKYLNNTPTTPPPMEATKVQAAALAALIHNPS